jgi:hypothetical protein
MTVEIGFCIIGKKSIESIKGIGKVTSTSERVLSEEASNSNTTQYASTD